MTQSLRSQLFRVVDIETTGLDARTDAIVELAWAIMTGDGTVASSKSTLINPRRPIPADASRIHGITDSDVAGAPTFEEVIEEHPDLTAPVLPAVCHNASFDSAFLSRSKAFVRGNPRFLCTLRLAENLVPGLPSYRLDFLCDHLGLAPAVGGPAPHRAGGDVALTCALLKRLIDTYLAQGYGDDIEGLFRMAVIQRMPFGKHQGRRLDEIPPDYIEWLLGRDIDDDLRAGLMAARRGQLPRPSREPSRGPAGRELRASRRRRWWPF